MFEENLHHSENFRLVHQNYDFPLEDSLASLQLSFFTPSFNWKYSQLFGITGFFSKKWLTYYLYQAKAIIDRAIDRANHPKCSFFTWGSIVQPQASFLEAPSDYLPRLCPFDLQNASILTTFLAHFATRPATYVHVRLDRFSSSKWFVWKAPLRIGRRLKSKFCQINGTADGLVIIISNVP